MLYAGILVNWCADLLLSICPGGQILLRKSAQRKPAKRYAQTKMRLTTIILIFATTIFLGCSNRADNKNNDGLTLTANWGGFNWRIPRISYTSDSANASVYDSATVIHVAVTISNPTSDTLQFPSMTCSYEDFFLMNDTINFKIQSRFDCYSNVPCQIVLPPKTKTDRYIMLRQLTNFRKLPTESIKIGMRLENKIIWSNELNPNRLTKEIYE